jgi:hypothetical protein
MGRGALQNRPDAGNYVKTPSSGTSYPVVLKVEDLPRFIAELKRQDFAFATRWKPVPVAGRS